MKRRDELLSEADAAIPDNKERKVSPAHIREQVKAVARNAVLISDEWAATLAAAAGADIPSGRCYCWIDRYDAASRPARALYVEQVSEPAHDMKFQARDGRWFAIDTTQRLTCLMFGIVPGYRFANQLGTDNYPAIQRLLAATGPVAVHWTPGKYYCGTGLVWPRAAGRRYWTGDGTEEGAAVATIYFPPNTTALTVDGDGSVLEGVELAGIDVTRTGYVWEHNEADGLLVFRYATYPPEPGDYEFYDCRFIDQLDGSFTIDSRANGTVGLVFAEANSFAIGDTLTGPVGATGVVLFASARFSMVVLTDVVGEFAKDETVTGPSGSAVITHVNAKRWSVAAISNVVGDLNANEEGRSMLVFRKAGDAGVGIDLQARMHIRGVQIRSFSGHAVQGRGDAHNFNLFEIDGLSVYQCGGSGVVVEGSDANAGNGHRISVVDCSGWGVVDQSFLGNNWDTVHLAGALAGGMHCTRASAITRLYTEQTTDYAPYPPCVSHITHSATVVSGTHGLPIAWDGADPPVHFRLGQVRARSVQVWDTATDVWRDVALKA